MIPLYRYSTETAKHNSELDVWREMILSILLYTIFSKKSSFFGPPPIFTPLRSVNIGGGPAA